MEPRFNSSLRFSVVGLGKLGACMAACIASRGLRVVGVDVRQATVECVNRGEAPVFEPGLTDLMRAGREHFRATSSYVEAVQRSDITFIVVPTPSEESGAFSLRYVAEAARGIGTALAGKRGYHLVVLTSTVSPGSTDPVVRQILEQAASKVCGPDFGLCYGPEFIALGSVIRDFLNPDFVLIGECDRRAGDLLADAYAEILEKEVPVTRMTPVNAEVAKLAVNTYVTTKITFANMLAGICERIPGADVDAVTAALGLDSRIGRRYLTGGLGYGGPCFPRDNLALAALAREVGADASLAEETDHWNRRQIAGVAAQAVNLTQPGARVSVLGLAYKPGTTVVDEAPGVYLASALAERGRKVVAYDPLALTTAQAALPPAVGHAATVEQAVAGTDLVVVATPDPAFAALPHVLRGASRPTTVLDCWRLFRGHYPGEGLVTYLPLGMGPSSGSRRPAQVAA